jgi:hypothetical protein
MAELQSRIVPLLVEKEDFWARYFYRCGVVAKALFDSSCSIAGSSILRVTITARHCPLVQHLTHAASLN